MPIFLGVGKWFLGGELPNPARGKADQSPRLSYARHMEATRETQCVGAAKLETDPRMYSPGKQEIETKSDYLCFFPRR